MNRLVMKIKRLLVNLKLKRLEVFGTMDLFDREVKRISLNVGVKMKTN